MIESEQLGDLFQILILNFVVNYVNLITFEYPSILQVSFKLWQASGTKYNFSSVVECGI